MKERKKSTTRSSSLSRMWERRRPATVEEYIASKTIRVGECLLWKTAKVGKVGNFSYKGRNGGAPRMVYIHCVGPLEDDECALHSCDDPRCVELKHLRPGTRKENREDFMQRHPKAMVLCLEAAKIGAIGVQKFWDSMNLEERKIFNKERAEKQNIKYPPGSESRKKQGAKMKGWWSSEDGLKRKEMMKLEDEKYRKIYPGKNK